MNIHYRETFENTDLEKSYSIQDDNNNEIGTVEGYGNDHGDLISVVKIFDPENQKSGLGFQAFNKVFQEINSNVAIQTIKGSWNSGKEFQDFEDGRSSNLKIYYHNRDNGKSEEESAMATATGKWAQKLGFNNCQVESISRNKVLVNFRKVNAS